MESRARERTSEQDPKRRPRKDAAEPENGQVHLVPPSIGSADHILAFQRVVGNSAVASLLKSRVQTEGVQRCGHGDSSRCSCRDARAAAAEPAELSPVVDRRASPADDAAGRDLGDAPRRQPADVGKRAARPRTSPPRRVRPRATTIERRRPDEEARRPEPQEGAPVAEEPLLPPEAAMDTAIGAADAGAGGSAEDGPGAGARAGRTVGTADRAVHRAEPPASEEIDRRHLDRQAVERVPAVTVQRGVGDLAAKVLPDWMLNLAKRGASKVKGFAGKLKGKAREYWDKGKRTFTKIRSKLTSGASKLWSKGKKVADKAKRTATRKVTRWIGKGKAAYAKVRDAAKRLARSGGLTGPLINPALPVKPEDAAKGIEHLRDVVSSIPGGVAGLGEDLGRAVKEGIGTGEWECDDSQIVAIAGGVKKAVVDNAVKAAKKVLGEDRYDRAVQFVETTIAKLRQVAESVKAGINKIKAAIAGWWNEHIRPVVDALKKVGEAVRARWNEIKGYLNRGWNKLKGAAAEAWERIKEVVGGASREAADRIKSRALDVYNSAKGAIGRLWNKLPGWLTGGLKMVGAGLVAPIAAPFYAAYKVGEKVGRFVAANKDKIVAAVKKGLDAALKVVAKIYNAVKERVKKAAGKLKEWGTAIGKAIRAGLSAAYEYVDGLTGGRITKMREALAAVGPKLKGEVCEALGDVAGPCIEQFVPDPGEAGGKGFANLTLSGEITVPVKGVPVKVAEGSTVKIEREGAGKASIYTVTILGDGLLAVSLAAGGGGGAGTGGGAGPVKLDVTLPKGLAFEKATGKSLGLKTPAGVTVGGEPIGGGAPTAGVPGLPAGPAAAGGAPSAKAGAAVEAGIKGSVAMVYKFDASKDQSTCDGLGGMAGMLASYGLAASLPAPLDTIGTQLAQGAFAEQLQSVKFTLAEYGSATFELAGGEDAIGEVKATIAAEAGIEIETKKEGDGTVHSATLSNQVSGGLAAAFTKALPGFGASAAASATMSLGLTYSEKADMVTASFAEAKLAASFGLTDVQKVLGLLPAGARGQVQSRLEAWLPAGKSTSGEISVEAALKVDKLHELGARIDDYFADPDAVTSDGLWDIVATHLENNYTQMLTVKAKQTSQETVFKVGVEAEQQSKGGKIGGKASAALERGIERETILYGPAPI